MNKRLSLPTKVHNRLDRPFELLKTPHTGMSISTWGVGGCSGRSSTISERSISELVAQGLDRPVIQSIFLDCPPKALHFE